MAEPREILAPPPPRPRRQLERVEDADRPTPGGRDMLSPPQGRERSQLDRLPEPQRPRSSIRSLPAPAQPSSMPPSHGTAGSPVVARGGPAAGRQGTAPAAAPAPSGTAGLGAIPDDCAVARVPERGFYLCYPSPFTFQLIRETFFKDRDLLAAIFSGKVLFDPSPGRHIIALNVRRGEPWRTRVEIPLFQVFLLTDVRFEACVANVGAPGSFLPLPDCALPLVSFGLSDGLNAQEVVGGRMLSGTSAVGRSAVEGLPGFGARIERRLGAFYDVEAAGMTPGVPEIVSVELKGYFVSRAVLDAALETCCLPGAGP